MPEVGENVSPNVETPPEQSEDVKKIKIRFSLFFDGTLNNRANVKSRNEEDKHHDEYLERKSSWLTILPIVSDLKGMVSYENTLSNVAKMEPHVKKIDEENSEYSYTLYIEGQGTVAFESDKFWGKAAGYGGSGVTERAKKGLEDLITTIQDDSRIEKGVLIECVTIDVFGFSRGAATARNFIHKIFDNRRHGHSNAIPLQKRLKFRGYPVEKVEVAFAGLYDSVSSVGAFSYKGNAEELHLNAIKHAKKVVQLAASEEYRKNFSLTNINSAGDNGKEIFLPGVHSDIGGGYRDTTNLAESKREEKVYYKGLNSDVQEDANFLINSGWFKEKDLNITLGRKTRRNNYPRGGISAKDRKVKNVYDRIPLHIMKKFTEESGLIIEETLDDDWYIPKELEDTYDKLLSYSSREDSVPDHWKTNDEFMIKLRSKHLHFSSNFSDTGMAPRLVDGKRLRLIIDG